MNAPVLNPRTLSDGLIEAARDAVRLPVGTRIVAAMSGGVDSTVTAALLAKAASDLSQAQRAVQASAQVFLALRGMSLLNNLTSSSGG